MSEKTSLREKFFAIKFVRGRFFCWGKNLLGKKFFGKIFFAGTKILPGKNFLSGKKNLEKRILSGKKKCNRFCSQFCLGQINAYFYIVTYYSCISCNHLIYIIMVPTFWTDEFP